MIWDFQFGCHVTTKSAFCFEIARKVNITIDIHNTTILRPILLLDQFAVKLTERYFTAKHTSGGSSGRIQDGG